MQKQCQRSQALVPSYLDGELSEEQAAPLRRHLLECQTCRDLAQDEQAMKRWFIAEEAPAAPHGFAARVARRAFAGDEGLLPELDRELRPVLATTEQREERTLQFVLQLTAAAAAVLFCLGLAIRTYNLPASEDLGATENYSEVLEGLELLNEAEALLEKQNLEAREKQLDQRGTGAIRKSAQ